ncbi:MAG: 5-formyltetrahydrofolate cyclo-ligase [Micavibrio aeruginosavorus]|uniref:5-formyltetrahydrofolate cyclo-ligase n=1 Tax=Micavibrio aeruginosavorus TaxID=349221 RepID=A0A2W5N006_9BACT|nr:MAG: 5-formyltetrahydrofolate cyclo-ligase [Micavibrio aeruginosavorus]
MIEKEELREQAVLHRDRIRRDDEDVENLVALFHESVPLKEGQVVGAYWPLDHEIDARYIIDDLLKKGTCVALPIASRKERAMVFSKWDGKGDLIRGNYGVFVPPDEKLVEPDVLLVPLLAFDRKGNRLGRGGGHYDATIAKLRATRDILTIGIAYAAQAVLFNLPVEEHDQKMDMIITPSGVHDFRS